LLFPGDARSPLSCPILPSTAVSTRQLVTRDLAHTISPGPRHFVSSPPPRRSRFGGPLALSKVHWVRPELVAEITYLGWTDEPLLRHTVFVGLREDKPAREVRREAATKP